LIAARGVVVDLGRRRVLDGVDLVVAAGAVVGLVGPPEAGKTVLLKALAGLVPWVAGSIEVCGVGGQSASQLEEKRAHIGMAFQNDALFDNLSVFENVAFPLRRRRMPDGEIEPRVLRALRAVELEASAAKVPAALSGGMKKRVGIARAVVMEPDVGLFDDPVAGLDPVTGSRVLALILEQAARLRMATVVVSNDLPVLLPLCGHVVMLHRGRVVFSGPPGDMSLAQAPEARQFVTGSDVGPL